MLIRSPDHYVHELRKAYTPSLLLIVLSHDVVDGFFSCVETTLLQRKLNIAGVQCALASGVNFIEHLLDEKYILLTDELGDVESRVELN